MMAAVKVQGLAMAVIDEGRVVSCGAGARNVAKDLPLQTDTILHGASLSKFAFGYMVMHDRVGPSLIRRDAGFFHRT